MSAIPRLLVAVASTLVVSVSPCSAQSSSTTAVPAVPAAPAAPPPPAATTTPATEKPEARKTGQDTAGKSKRSKEKKETKTAGFDPKSLLLKLLLTTDDDGDGALSTEEFRRLPLLKELKKERIDSLFAEIDTDRNASLTTDEIGKGFSKITDLAKEKRGLPDDADAAKQAKKLRRLVP